LFEALLNTSEITFGGGLMEFSIDDNACAISPVKLLPVGIILPSQTRQISGTWG